MIGRWLCRHGLHRHIVTVFQGERSGRMMKRYQCTRCQHITLKYDGTWSEA